MTAKHDVVIYHNPACGTSRNALEFIRKRGIEPQIIEYLKTPPTREKLVDLIKRIGGGARAVIRQKEKLYTELGLDDPSVSDEKLIDAMMAHPILINRPIVITRKGVKLCRPSETVNELL